MGSFSELFSVKEILNSKGFEVVSEGNGYDLLIPIPSYLGIKDHDILFHAFNGQESRGQLLKRVLDSNFLVTDLSTNDLINHPSFVPDRKRFSTSFEWYVGELMVRKFSAFSASYSIEVKDVLGNSVGIRPGDYDAIVILRDLNFVYFECKTGKFDRNKLLKCFDRAIALHCQFSIMFIQGPINLKSLKGCIQGIIHPFVYNTQLEEISIKGNAASKVIEWNNCFLITAEGNIEEQMRTIMRVNAAKKLTYFYNFGMSDEDFQAMGYVR